MSLYRCPDPKLDRIARDRYIVESSPGPDGKPDCWHDFRNDDPDDFICNCGIEHQFPGVPLNPDFTADPVACLRVMMRRPDRALFIYSIRGVKTYGDKEGNTWEYCIPTDYILDTTGLLADAAAEFIKEVSHE